MVLNFIMFLAFCRDQGFQLMDGQGNRISINDARQQADEMESEEEQISFLRSLSVTDSERSFYHTLSVEFGKVRPWQWVTNNFMHAGWMHLIGNLVFLWAFGIIVEGKVGWFWFSIIYLGIGTVYGMVLQLGALAFGMDEGIALGASAAIFGLLALCVAWAPANEFEVLWIIGFRIFMSEIRIITFGGIFLFKELIFWGLQGFQMSSELLHILGFAVALPVGLGLVKYGLVDCEGWDIFSYLGGTTGQESPTHINYQKSADKRAGIMRSDQALQLAAQPQSPPTNLLQSQVEEALDQGTIDVAIKLQNLISRNNPGAIWRQKDLYRVINGLLKASRHAEALPLIQTYLQNYEESRFAMELAMLKIWLQQQRPRKTLQYIDGMNLAFYTPEQNTKLQPLIDKAKRLVAAGIVDSD